MSKYHTAAVCKTACELSKQFRKLSRINGAIISDPLADAIEATERAIGRLVVESSLARRHVIDAAYKCGRRLARHGQPLDNTADRADMAGDELLAMQAGHAAELARLQRKGGGR